MRGLKDKVCIVAGGARGIGAATAKRLCEEGAKVVIGDVLLDLAQKTAESINSEGGQAIAMYLDGTDINSQKEIVNRAIETFGKLDVYHSNLAGGTQGDTDVLSIAEDAVDKSFAINTKSHLLATQVALPKLLENGRGSLIYTSSGAASGGNPNQPAYAMTKNAIHALARHVASKWGRSGIRANVICPGLIMTEAVSIHLDEKMIEGMQKRTPSDRLGQPEDIAAIAAFLASDDSGFVNGQVWHVNGGTQMRD